MSKELSVKVGDIVLYYNGSFYKNDLPIITKVAKITPTGRIRIEYSPSRQFDKYGLEMGSNSWRRSSIEVPTAEKLQEIKKRTFIRRTIRKMRDCEERNISYEQAVSIMKLLKGGSGDE